MKGQDLHLCDFDGTLTKGDSFLRFLLFSLRPARMAMGVCVLIFKFLSLLLTWRWSNEAAKMAVFSVFFKGKTAQEMELLGTGFCQQKLPLLLRVELLETLRQARDQGDLVVVVSASSGLWLRPFCTKEGFGLLCTELEFEAGRFTGKFATPNCNHAEKARRVRAAYELGAFQRVLAYGNSRGDEAMFALADQVFRL